MTLENGHDQPKPNAGESAETITVDQLPERLGFVESEELSALHAQVTETVPLGDEVQIRDLVFQYLEKGEKVVDQKQGDDFPRAQVGFLVAKALLWKEAGRVDYYSSDLRDALTYAENMGYEDTVTVLEAALTEARIQENARQAKPELLYVDPNTGEPTSEPVDKKFTSTVGREVLEAVSQSGQSETEQSKETPEDVTTEEIINLHRVLKDIGVDFEEIDVEHLKVMPVDEVIGHLFDALIEAGVEDPEAYLKEKGILE
ncbi:MAG: hypothetical protein AAB896_01680 [Patescibacteria group bacterium]